MWIVADSGTWYPTLIEIESPTKKLFTQAKVQRSEFTQARSQLTQWRTWFQNPINVQKFVQEYGIPARWCSSMECRPRRILVYGRRAEFDTLPELARLRSSLLGTDEELMSFDRLESDSSLEVIITVRAIGEGRFHAVAVPETFGIRPYGADNLKRIDGLAQAIDQNYAIPAARKAFLKQRIKYWRERDSPTGGPRDIFTIE